MGRWPHGIYALLPQVIAHEREDLVLRETPPLNHHLTQWRHTATMALTAEQHSEIATAYEQYAADRFVPPEHRAEFARKANWFRLAARLAAKHQSRTKCPPPQGKSLETPWLRNPRS